MQRISLQGTFCDIPTNWRDLALAEHRIDFVCVNTDILDTLNAQGLVLLTKKA